MRGLQGLISLWCRCESTHHGPSRSVVKNGGLRILDIHTLGVGYAADGHDVRRVDISILDAQADNLVSREVEVGCHREETFDVLRFRLFPAIECTAQIQDTDPVGVFLSVDIRVAYGEKDGSV